MAFNPVPGEFEIPPDEPQPVVAMVKWFFDHYEDPAEHLPYESAEGGYQWIYGGPYSPDLELQSQFEETNDIAHIERAIAIVTSFGGWEWVKIADVNKADEETRA